LAPRDQVDGIAELLVAKARQFYPVIDANPDYTAIVNQAQFDRLQAMRAEAESLGARVRTADNIDIGGRKMPLTVLLDTTAEMAVRGEEIFGPLLPIIPYDDIGAAIIHVNGGPRPLALYVYGADRGLINRVLAETMSGGAVVNDCFIHAGVEELPFGGVGASGMGHYHGREGFETFSKLKPVMYQSRWNGLWLLNPPYGARARGMINLLLKR
jgi:acyl-CoA reductase-like NAD-dependent aldehyde dehydrogenase